MKRTARTRRARRRLALVAAIAGVLALAATVGARQSQAAGPPAAEQAAGAGTASSAPAASTAARDGAPAPMVRHTARGEFDVKVAPLAEDEAAGITLGRMSLEKTFRGALAATSKGEMLTVDAKDPSSGAYAATERVVGTLDGRRGSFALVHVGTMSKGAYELRISIVPESGTGELAGVAGTLAIEIREGKHFYVLDYTLPAR